MRNKQPRAIGPRKVVVYVARAISYVLYFYLIVVEIILFIGFFLLLFGANPSAGFTEWAYRNLDRVMEPFRGIFTPIELGTTNGNVESIFETSVLFAMIIYGIIAIALNALISWLSLRLMHLEMAEREAEDLAAQQAADVRTASVYVSATTGTPTDSQPPPLPPPTS